MKTIQLLKKNLILRVFIVLCDLTYHYLIEVIELTEFLALNVHESWGQEKISNGWTFGEKYDEERKKTPNLVAYEDLPEHVKEVFKEGQEDKI